MSSALPVVYAPNELSKHLWRGHPWIYRDRLLRAPSLPSGTWIQVQAGTFNGYGLWDAQSPIAVRLFSRRQVPDAAWVAAQITRAWDMRAPLRAAGTTAYRWLYGEGDGIPGLVVDLYERYAVIETYAGSLETLLGWVVDGLRACAPLRGILVRGDDVDLVWGRQPPRDLVIEENGIRFYVDLYAGQKTGLYLDQRENRHYLESWCEGKRVLNCFAYTGGFTLYAVRGGAREVTSVDIAAPAIEQVQRNLELNGMDPDLHPAFAADCFELLEQYATEGEQFDLIVLDPPSLARSKQKRYAAQRAYVRLNQAALRCVVSGGLLATASCTSQVSPEAFREVLGDAAVQAERELQILHEAGHAIDHPVPAHFPEGRYLKFVLGRVQEIR